MVSAIGLSHVQVIFWLALALKIQFYETTSVEEIESLRVAAWELGLPSGTWNFSTDPCLNGWKGIICCVENSTPSDYLCCASFEYCDSSSKNTSPNARVSALILPRDKFDNNTLNGTLSNSLCNLTLLMNLDIRGHRLRGEIPQCIGKLSNLWYIRLGGNLLNGSIPKTLGALSNLTTLSLESNNLEGEIPEEIGHLSSLETLELQMNKLKGEIPSSFSNLWSLARLNLFNNELSGELSPMTFQNISYIELNLRRNNFTGRVPAFRNGYPGTIDLGFNHFSGSIPDIGNMQNLFLGHNRLNGSIPANFSSLQILGRLDLSHNMLVGSLTSLEVIGQNVPELDISFNFLNLSIASPSSITSQHHPSTNAFFNCNASSVSCSSSGTEMFFAVNSGGNDINSISESGVQIRFDGDNKTFEYNPSVGFFYGKGPWALALSGDSAGTYSPSTQKPINLSGAGSWASQELYSSMRWSSTYIAYHGHSLRVGLYTVTVLFAELVFLEPGYRVFDVILQGEVWVKNLDIVSEVGPRAAYQITRNITVTNGSVSIELVQSGPNRYLSAVTWPVESSGPIISGVSVVSVSYTGEPLAAGSTRRLNVSRIAEIAAGVGILGILMLVLVLCFCFRRVKRKTLHFVYSSGAPSQPNFLEEASLGSGGAMSYQDVFNATQGFSEKIGEGGFGAVYKGTLPNGALIAVKQLVKKNTQLTKHNAQIEDFHKEISIISKVRHRNLLAVIGHSLESDIPMLVCEFIPNGSLDRWLWKKDQVLSWEVRRKIAIGVSCGLAYLHDESTSKIVHCDVKPANILLDSDFNPRIADFGLARLYDAKETHVTATRLKGTPGYLAPEYVMELQLSDKVDVYSFGVVLLELLSGRRVVEVAAPTEQIILVDWAHTEARVPEKMLDIMDKRLQGQYVEQEARDMVTIAILCTQSSASLRPKMQSVWLMLNGTIKVPEFLEDLEAAESHFTTSIEATSSSTGY